MIVHLISDGEGLYLIVLLSPPLLLYFDNWLNILLPLFPLFFRQEVTLFVVANSPAFTLSLDEHTMENQRALFVVLPALTMFQPGLPVTDVRKFAALVVE